MKERIMDLSDLFFSSSVSQVAAGYARESSPESFVCLVCGHRAEAGRVYPFGDVFYDAERYIRAHIGEAHGSMLEYLLGLDKSLTGLGEQQRMLLKLSRQGLGDKEIASRLGIAGSTVRNHRFALRERAKQARLFLAVMQLIESDESGGERLIPVRRSATMVDERYAVTEAERDSILSKYFLEGRLSEFPTRQKRKLVVLGRIAESFAPGRRYTEKECNEAIKAFFDDYVTIRRYLIEYGFLDRKPDGSAYWLKE
jgi:hypothetical protein